MMIDVSSPPEYARTTFLGMCTPDRETAGAAPQQQHENGLLHMQAAFGLIEDHRPWRVHDRIGHFLPTMRGQAVHEHSARTCFSHQLIIDLVRLKNRDACLGLTLLPHTGPGVSVHGIRASNGLMRVAQDL